MVATSMLIAASGFLSLAYGAPVLRRQANGAKDYHVFGGDGTISQGWPAQSQWLNFDALWALNEGTIKNSCTQFGVPNNSDEETSQVKAALTKVAGDTGLNPSYLLAVMIQESKGCVRAPTTNYGQENPGLFQSFNGKHSCNNGGVKTPCPQSEIEGMVTEGAGIGLGFGLTQALQQSNANDDSKYYKAARIYNSGSVAPSGNLGDGIATHCYATDIANRLVGWPDDSAHHSLCQEGSIGGVQGSNGAYAGGNTTPAPGPSQPSDDKQGSAPSNPPTTPPSSQPTGPKIPGAAANCKSWYTVKSGDNCSNLPASFDVLRKLNSNLDANCTNLWLGYAYCTAA